MGGVRESLNEAGEIEIVSDSKIIRIECQDSAVSVTKGKEKELQDNLRKLLFKVQD